MGIFLGGVNEGIFALWSISSHQRFFLKIQFIRKQEDKQLVLHVNVFLNENHILFFQYDKNSKKWPKFQPNVIRIEKKINFETFLVRNIKCPFL